MYLIPVFTGIKPLVIINVTFTELKWSINNSRFTKNKF